MATVGLKLLNLTNSFNISFRNDDTAAQSCDLFIYFFSSSKTKLFQKNPSRNSGNHLVQLFFEYF